MILTVESQLTALSSVLCALYRRAARLEAHGFRYKIEPHVYHSYSKLQIKFVDEIKRNTFKFQHNFGLTCVQD